MLIGGVEEGTHDVLFNDEPTGLKIEVSGGSSVANGALEGDDGVVTFRNGSAAWAFFRVRANWASGSGGGSGSIEATYTLPRALWAVEETPELFLEDEDVTGAGVVVVGGGQLVVTATHDGDNASAADFTWAPAVQGGTLINGTIDNSEEKVSTYTVASLTSAFSARITSSALYLVELKNLKVDGEQVFEQSAISPDFTLRLRSAPTQNFATGELSISGTTTLSFLVPGAAAPGQIYDVYYKGRRTGASFTIVDDGDDIDAANFVTVSFNAANLDAATSPQPSLAWTNRVVGRYHLGDTWPAAGTDENNAVRDGRIFTVTSGDVLYREAKSMLRLAAVNPVMAATAGVSSFVYQWEAKGDYTADKFAGTVGDGKDSLTTVSLLADEPLDATVTLDPRYFVTVSLKLNGAASVGAIQWYALGSELGTDVSNNEAGEVDAAAPTAPSAGVVTFRDVKASYCPVEKDTTKYWINTVLNSSAVTANGTTNREIVVSRDSRAFDLDTYGLIFGFALSYCGGTAAPDADAIPACNTQVLGMKAFYEDSETELGEMDNELSSGTPFIILPNKDITFQVTNGDGAAHKANMFTYTWTFTGVNRATVTTTSDTVVIPASLLMSLGNAPITVTCTPASIQKALTDNEDKVWALIRGENAAAKVGTGADARYSISENLTLGITPAQIAAAIGVPVEVLGSGAVTYSLAGTGITTDPAGVMGVVTRPAFSASPAGSEVTLTVTVALVGDGSVTHSFLLTILPFPPTDGEAVNEVVTHLTGIGGWNNVIRGQNTNALDVRFDLETLPRNVAELAVILQKNPGANATALSRIANIEGVAIAWSSNRPSVVSNTGTVTRPQFIAGVNNDSVVTLTATVSKGAAVSTPALTWSLTVRAFTSADDQKVTALVNMLNWNVIRGDNGTVEGRATRDLVLPVNGMFPANADARLAGVKISWALSSGATDALKLDAAPAAIEDNTAPIALEVARPSTGADVARTLTGTVTFETVTLTVVFDLTVPVKGAINPGHIQFNASEAVYTGGFLRAAAASFVTGAGAAYASGGPIDTTYTYTRSGFVPFVYKRDAGESKDPAVGELPTEAGTYNVTVMFENRDFRGVSDVRTFTIEKRTLTDEMLVLALADEGYVYFGGAVPMFYNVIVDGEILDPANYTGSFTGGADISNNVNAGEAVVSITGTGNYDGVATQKFTIAPRPISVRTTGNNAVAVAGKIYDGTAEISAAAITTPAGMFLDMVGSQTLVRGTDYAVTGVYSSANAGTVSAAVTVELLNTDLANNYVLPASTVTIPGITIARRTLVPADLNIVASVVYNASEQPIVIGDEIVNTDSVTVTYNGGNSIPVDAGTYAVKVVVADGANYDGITVEFTYTIEQVATTKDDLVVGDLVVKYDSTAKALSVSLPGDGYGEIKVTYDGDDLNDDGLPVELGKYTVTVEVTGGVNYKAGTFTFEFWIDDGTSVAEIEKVIPESDKDVAIVTPGRIFSTVFTAGPNPVSRNAGSVALFWQGKAINSATLSVFAANGSLVNRISISDNGTGTARRQVGSWNLRDTQGRQVSEGTYLIRGTVTGKDGSTERVTYKISVR
jgi:hypothetical protein